MKIKPPAVGTKTFLTVTDIDGDKFNIRGSEDGTEEDIVTLMFGYLNSKKQLTRMFKLMLSAAGLRGENYE